MAVIEFVDRFDFILFYFCRLFRMTLPHHPQCQSNVVPREGELRKAKPPSAAGSKNIVQAVQEVLDSTLNK